MGALLKLPDRRDPRTPRAVVPGPTARDTRVYACDPQHDAIAVFDGDGRCVMAFGGHGSRPGQFRTPAAIALVRPQFAGEAPAADLEPLVAVADQGNHRVQIFAMDGTLVACVGHKAANGFLPRHWRWVGVEPAFDHPYGLAWTAPYLDVTCTGGRLVRLNLADAMGPSSGVHAECA